MIEYRLMFVPVFLTEGREVHNLRTVDMYPKIPTFIEEEKLRQQGYRFIAGVDEVGRGPLAGPVVAAAVILPHEARNSWLDEVRDSKLLTPSKRQYLCECIKKEAKAFGIGIANNEIVDNLGIVAATRIAMCLAVKQLAWPADFLLIDALSLPELLLPHKSLIHGDRISISIAAASIIAKVYRDQLMDEFDTLYPGYGFSQNKGYPTAKHLKSLERFGPSPIHRKTFSPVKRVLKVEI